MRFRECLTKGDPMPNVTRARTCAPPANGPTMPEEALESESMWTCELHRAESFWKAFSAAAMISKFEAIGLPILTGTT